MFVLSTFVVMHFLNRLVNIEGNVSVLQEKTVLHLHCELEKEVCNLSVMCIEGFYLFGNSKSLEDIWEQHAVLFISRKYYV